MEITPSTHSDKALYDIELVERAKGGDEKAYAKLLSRYRDSIYFMLLKMVGSKVDAEDLTIEAFGKAFRNIELYSTSYAFSTWLFKIASNNGIDFLRRKKAKVVSIDQDESDKDENGARQITICDDQPDPSESMIRSQTVETVRAVVDKLKPRYKRLVELRYFKELTYEEIAEQLDMPIGTVKAQLFRSRELLYNILKNTEAAQDR
ncbi:MAG: RNA polymerase sigma factor [Marinilabiliaceae bacterium]